MWPWFRPSETDRGKLLGRKSGLDQSWLGHLSEGYDVGRPETPMTLGYITEDTSQLHPCDVFIRVIAIYSDS